MDEEPDYDDLPENDDSYVVILYVFVFGLIWACLIGSYLLWRFAP